MEPQTIAFYLLLVFAGAFALLAAVARYWGRIPRGNGRTGAIADRENLAETRRRVHAQASEE